MHYDDEIYGAVEITEAVLIDLMASTAMQRSKGIYQHGVTAFLGITPPFSRFDHAVGVMLLVRRLGASLVEQVAALLHDVSHTAFSHVIDYVFDDHDGQSYHEHKKEAFVAASDIPQILRRHGIDWREIMNEEQFSLLEQPLPALCADRVDYFLRDLEFLKLADRREIRAAINALETVDGRIVVNNPDTAGWLAYTFIEADKASWSSFREVGLYQLTAEAIKAGMQHGVIDDSDIWGGDDILWSKLRSSNHPQVRQWAALISPGTRFVWDEEAPDFRVSTKIRSIDPLVKTNNSLQHLSSIDPLFARHRAGYMAGKQGAWPMRVVSDIIID